MKAREIRVFSENSHYQYIETLRRNRKKRKQAGEFFVEGVRSITQAVEHGWQLNALAFSPERRLSKWAVETIEKARADRHYLLSSGLMEKLSQKEEPSELIALAAIPDPDITKILHLEADLVVVLDRPARPGNIGAIIRSCDAFGADGLIVTGHSADLYDPEAIRAATGSFFALPSAQLPSQKELIPQIERLRNRPQGLAVVGSSARASLHLSDFDSRKPIMLLAGSENHGLSKAYREMCDVMVKIPMEGSASSLNLASAVSVMLYEVRRQRNDWQFTGPG